MRCHELHRLQNKLRQLVHGKSEKFYCPTICFCDVIQTSSTMENNHNVHIFLMFSCMIFSSFVICSLLVFSFVPPLVLSLDFVVRQRCSGQG